MIIEARYRDIPFEELLAHGHRDEEFTRTRWPKSRGQKILIRLPAENRRVNYGCTQPRYVVVQPNGEPLINARGNRVSVCPHIVEIGD